MKRNVLAGGIIGGFLFSAGILMACPTPVPKFSPLVVPVTETSVATYIQDDPDYNIYDPGDGDPYVGLGYTCTISVFPQTGSPSDGWEVIGALQNTVQWNKPGHYDVEVEIDADWWNDEDETVCHSSGTKGFQVTVVGVKTIQYKWGSLSWTDALAQPTNYVPTATNVNFQAIPDPADASWPDGKPVWGGAAGSGASASQTFATPGAYDITAECGNSVTGKMCAVKVDSLLPNLFEREVDDNDGNPDTRTFVVNMTTNIGDIVTITATPAPNIAEANLPICWTLQATEGTANGAGKLIRTIDKTQPSKTVIRCSCGNEKITTVYVVRCTYSALCDNSGVVGHGWWHLGIAPTSAISGVLEKINPLFTPIINIDGGFWPARHSHPHDRGRILIGPQGHTTTAQHEWVIPFQNLINGLTDLSAWQGAVGNYDITRVIAFGGQSVSVMLRGLRCRFFIIYRRQFRHSVAFGIHGN